LKYKLKTLHISNRCGTRNRKSKSYRKVHNTVDKSICVW